MKMYYRKHKRKLIRRQHDKYINDASYREPMKAKARDKGRKAKVIVLEAYGRTRCACCGESDRRFLTIDHIDGGGRAMRKQQGSGNRLYLWLIKHEYPDGYQVLCFNCNCGRQVNKGVCPHKDAKRKAA